MLRGSSGQGARPGEPADPGADGGVFRRAWTGEGLSTGGGSGASQPRRARPSVVGLTYVTVELSAPDARKRRPYSASFLVDTGATDTFAPGKRLRKAGIKPIAKTSYELANGSVVEYEYGLARIEFMGEVTAGRVIFGPDDSEPLLGVTALESVGILVDPAKKTPKRLPAIPLK